MVKYDLYMKPSQAWDCELNYSIENSDGVYRFVSEKLKLQDRDREVMLVIALSSMGEILGFMESSIGELNSIGVQPREVAKFLITANATAGAIVHNHPSGNEIPSEGDIETTERLVKCGQLIGIPIIDHLVIGRNGFYSMREHGDIG